MIIFEFRGEIMENKTMKIGVNTHFDRVRDDDAQYECVKDYVDFLVCHTDPQGTSLAEAVENTRKAVDTLEKAGIGYVANFEFQNFVHDVTAPDGTEWALNTDTLHRLVIPDEYIKMLTSGEHSEGIMYDEFEHAIINQNLSIILASKGKVKKSVFPLSESEDPVEQGELLSKQLADYAAEMKNRGAKRLMGEHVFPVLFHTFARNGITPNFKSQKESVSDIQFAIASGAALEYGIELWNCVDCWYRLTNPGHSADEMYNNLMFAYYAGVNNVYVVSTGVFTQNGERFEYGRKFREFSVKFRGARRKYDIHDFRPETGIIRYDDTYWGQGDPMLWRYMLFGNKKIKPTKKSKEYVKVFSLITHGETSKGSYSWNKISPYALRKHRSFMTMNSTAVFDDRVKKETLKSLKLCFLTGISISDETLGAVAELVRENGLTVVTPKRFAPQEILKNAKGSYSEIRDGKGVWIVTDKIAGARVKKRIAPFLGNKGEIRLTFENNTVTMKISPDGNALSVEEKEI